MPDVGKKWIATRAEGQEPLVVGLTGGVGCGKTVVAQEFARHGAFIIFGDRAGHEVVDLNAGLQKALARQFGNDILQAGKINRRKLAGRAFRSAEGRQRLNDLVHPALIKELTRRVRAARKRHIEPLIVVDAALLVEWEMKVPVDLLIAVWAPRAKRLRWLRKRGWTTAEIKDRMRSQLPFARRKVIADFVIRNDGDLATLRRKAARLWQRLLDHR